MATNDRSSDLFGRRSRIRKFVQLAAQYWTGEHRRKAFFLTFFVGATVAVQLATQLALNQWNRHFFDALEHRRTDELTQSVVLLPLLVVLCGVAVSAALVARLTLQLRWREWMVRRLAGWWIEDQRYYRLSIASEELSSPESRIADDVRLAIEPLVDFAIGVVTALVTALAFVGVLWSVGGAARFSLGGVDFYIPGYLAVSAVVYTIVTGALSYFTGRPLVRAIQRKNGVEAEFRGELTRLRDNAESIALIRGDLDEQRSALAYFRKVVDAWRSVIWRNGVIAVVQSANGAFVPLVPLVLVAPKYLGNELSLGAVMQLASAFTLVQGSLNWFIDNFVRVAEWMASANRVDQLTEALESLDTSMTMEEDQAIEFLESADDKIRIENLSIAHRNGRAVIADTNVVISAGEKLLVGGESGSGKSTLIRALAGLWPWGSGKIYLPKGC